MTGVPTSPLSREAVDARVSERKAGRAGPLSMACYDGRGDECGLWGCRCRCHFVTPAHLRRLMRGGDPR